MKIILSKQKINLLLFIICVIVPFLNIYELSFVVWSLILVVTLKNNYALDFIKYVTVFVVVLILAIVVGLFFDYKFYYVIRDITYLLKPITGLIIGYQLFSNKIKHPFQFIVYAGVAIAVYHLILVANGIIFEGARNVRDIRQFGGYFNDFEIYTLIILIFNKRFDLQFSKNKTIAFLTILSISSFFYLARTNVIQFIILYLALKGYFILSIKSIKVISYTLLAVALGYSAVLYYNPIRNGKGVDEFLYKIKMSPQEAFSTKINRDDWQRFNDNYRSYENIRTIQQLSYNKNLFFGEGIGSQVDLKQRVYLGDMELRYISILHNGYMLVLLKTGLFGLLIYLFSIVLFFKKNKHPNPTLININYLFVGTGIFLIISNWVFMGFYNLADTKSLLIGFLFAYRHELIKKLQIQNFQNQKPN